jgi:predicted lipoprotein
MRRIVLTLSLLVAAGIVGWFWPLFHVVSLEARSADRKPAQFHAAEFAAKFWDSSLAAALPGAADAAKLLAALRENPQQAREEFGLSVGLSRKYYFFVRGAGTIVAVNDKEVGVALQDDGRQADVLFVRGLVFGNAARDATGLLNPSDFPNSQHFNDISTALNRLVEARVLPALNKRAEVGRPIQFVGCAEAEIQAGGQVQLKCIPLEVRFD